MKKRKVEFWNVICAILVFAVDFLPIIVVLLFALFYNINADDIIYKDFIESGNLIWIGCTYMGVVFTFILQMNLEKHQNLTKVLMLLVFSGIFIGGIAYLLIKMSYYNLAKEMDHNTLIIASWSIFGFMFLCYLIKTVASFLIYSGDKKEKKDDSN